MASPDRTQLMEMLALYSECSLSDFCSRLQRICELPGFRFDSENETEWGLVEVANVEYNVSRPFTEGTLQEWDDSVPAGCNIGLSLIIYREHANANHEWAIDNLVRPIARRIANEFQETVYYHRTWLGVGNNVTRQETFEANAG